MGNPAVEKVQINQNSGGYRYSVEPFLLANWVHPPAGARVLDIGTGCGIIPLLLLTRQKNLEITALEIQPSLAEKAGENAFANGWSDRIRVKLGDFSEIAADFPNESFDWILSNPPYRKKNSGKINPCPEKALARHELAMTLETLVETSARLLKPGGKIALVYPFGRLKEVLKQLRGNLLIPSRVVRVYGHQEAEPKICLVEAVRDEGPSAPEESSLTLYHPDGRYTEALKNIYASFNYPWRSHRFREK